jgi:hypothetical protein
MKCADLAASQLFGTAKRFYDEINDEREGEPKPAPFASVHLGGGSPLIVAKVCVVTGAAAPGERRTESAAACTPRHHGEGVEAALAGDNGVTVDVLHGNAVLRRLRERRRSYACGSDGDEDKFRNAGHYQSPGWKPRKALCLLASAHEIGTHRLAFHHGCVRTTQLLRATQ